MLKNFLKSSVSALILVSLVVQPSLAMDPPDKPEKKIIKRAKKNDEASPKVDDSKPSKVIPQIPEKGGATYFEKVENIPSHSNPYKKLWENKEILRNMLFWRGLDKKTVKNTSLVCKDWYNLITDENSVFICALNNLFVHPSAFDFALKVRAAKFPHKTIYQGFMHDPKTGDLVTPQVYEIPQNVGTYISKIMQYPEKVCDQFTCLDPLKYKEIGLASYTIKQDSFLSNLMKEKLKEISFDYDQFPALILDPENHDSMQRHLMALKLLTLSGDSLVKEDMDKFTNVLAHFFRDIRNSNLMTPGDFNLEFYLQNNPTFLEQPFWSGYTVKTTNGNHGFFSSDCPLWLEWERLGSIMDTRHGILLCPFLPKVEQFFNHYAFVLNSGPDLSVESQLDNLRFFTTGQYVSPTRLLTLEEEYKRANQKDYYSLYLIAKDYAEVRQYTKALEILENSLRGVEDSPFRFRILFHMGRILLESGNKDLLPKAKECLMHVEQEFKRIRAMNLNDNDWRLDTTFQEGPSKDSPYVFVDEFLEMIVAFDIATGNFDGAIQCIKQNELDLDSRALKVAVQSQLPHLPKKLKKLLVKGFTKCSKDDLKHPSMRQELIEFEDLYVDFLKETEWKKKKKFKEVMKETQQIIAQHSAQTEMQGDGQNLPQANQPGSNKKDKKDKNDKKKK